MRNDRNNQQPDPASSDADPLAPPALPDIVFTAAPLSRGPLTAIYRGWDRVRHYNVIVKVQQAAGDPVAADRFRREAAVMARLRHPNIVALYQFQDGNPSALIMEYVSGQTLDALIQADGRLKPDHAARIIEEIAAALDCIHAENVVHRDVKPSNILLPKHGPARLTDFGVAHIDAESPLTLQGDMLGTIEYASPEQVKGTSVPDARSDVYSLAAVAYFALTGTPPFRAADNTMQSQLSVMHQQVFSEPPPLRVHREDLSPGIDTAVRRGLAKDPEARYPSAGQLASALRSAVVAASGTPERAAMATTSRRSAVLAGVLAGAALLVGGAVVVWNHEQSAFVPVSNSHPAPVLPTAALPAKTIPHKAVGTPKPAVIAALSSSQPRTARLHAARPVSIASSMLAPRPVHVAHALPLVLPEHKALALALLSQKRVVTERPKYRRHPALLAEIRRPAPFVAAKLPHAATLSHAATSPAASGTAWLAVYARQNTSLPGQPLQTAAIPASQVTVDGKPIAALASGGWATLPAGKHLIAYVPAGQSGYGANPGLWVVLAPGAHMSRQILLPIQSSGWARPVAALTASAVPSPPKSAAPQAPASWLPPAQPRVADAAPAAPAAVGWYNVSGWIVRNPTAPKPTLIRTSAYWVKVDGKPILSLAMGKWAELPAGKHTVTFQPTNGVGVDAKTWDIDLAPQAHLDQQIPLPNSPVPNSPGITK